MRTVAVALAVLSVAALIPPSASANDCVAPSQQSLTVAFCVPVPATKPASQVPDTVYWDTYYIWLGPGPCGSSPVGADCRGVPAEQAGVPLPGGSLPSGSVGAGVFGVLWKETNGLSGLQRQSVIIGRLFVPDSMVLV